MMLLIFKCAEAQCFKDNAELSANSLDYKITLILQTFDPIEKTCEGAIDDPDTFAELFYYDGTAALSIRENFLFTGIGNHTIIFDLSAEQADFATIEKLNLLHYVIQLRGNEPTKGAIQTIRHTEMNATSCWDGIELYYNREATQEMLTFHGRPLNCDITNPEVFFEYNVEGTWHQFEVIGNPQYSSAENVYYKGMTPYEFGDISYYAEYKADLPLGDEVIMEQFFTNFSVNRDIHCRLKIISEVSAMHEEIVLGEITVLIATFTLCSQAMNPMMFITEKFAMFVADQEKYPEIADCPEGVVYFSTEMVLYVDEDTFILPAMSNTYDEYISRSGTQFYFNNLWVGVLDTEEISYATYLTGFDDQDQVIMESSIMGKAYVTCIVEHVFTMRGTKACADIAFYDSPRCVFSGKTQYELILITEENGFASRKTYFSYLIDLEYTTTIKRFCSSTQGQSYLGEKINGTRAERKKIFEKKVASGSKLFIFLRQRQEYITEPFIHLEDENQLLMWFFIIFGILFVGTLGVAGYLIASDAKLKR